MLDWIQISGPNRAVEVLGVRLVGVTAENGRKLLFTVVFVGVVLLLGRAARAGLSRVVATRREQRSAFWARQIVQLASALVLVLGLASIWFDDQARLTTGLGLVSAGLAFALQKVVTAVAGYFVILRGRTFNVGDRIVMGGVRGDVVALGFTQTTIMEMGQPPPVQGAEPAMWVRSREYTGRVVTVSNAKVFDEPVFNYTRELPYIWEELSLPVPYDADRVEAERILLEVARRHTTPIAELSAQTVHELERTLAIRASELAPRVYQRITADWVELTVRFLVPDHGIRRIKDNMSREILDGLSRARIRVASTTVEIVGVPNVGVVFSDPTLSARREAGSGYRERRAPHR